MAEDVITVIAKAYYEHQIALGQGQLIELRLMLKQNVFKNFRVETYFNKRIDDVTETIRLCEVELAKL